MEKLFKGNFCFPRNLNYTGISRKLFRKLPTNYATIFNNQSPVVTTEKSADVDKFSDLLKNSEGFFSVCLGHETSSL